MLLGLVCSSGGGVFTAGIELLRGCGYCPSAFVVTDRSCGVETACERLGIEWKRIEDSTRQGFSIQAASWLIDRHKVNWTCLFFTRLVSAELFKRAPCVNIHPSLLPAFPGFGSVRRAWESGSNFLGATAHLTDDSTDAGSILSQVVAPIVDGTPLDALERLSFAQKLYLFLVLWEMAERKELAASIGKRKTPIIGPVQSWANPCLRDQRLVIAFEEFIKKESIVWIR